MKTLFLIRHAKSSRDDPTLPDEKRPLSERGERDAPRIGKRLAADGVEPDLILSSPAVRAHATAQIIAEKLGYKARDIVIDKRLYRAAPDELLRVIHEITGKPKRVMVFGHNPEFSELAHRLSRDITHMPTCAVAQFAFDAASWAAVGKRPPTRVALLTPKQL